MTGRQAVQGGNIFLVMIILLAALIGGVAIAYYVVINLVIYTTIENQPTGVRLPESIDVTAEVQNDLDVFMRGEIETAVPFRQELKVPFRGRYDFDVELNAQVPLKFDIAFDGVIPVNSEADVTIRTGLNYKNLKSLRNLVIRTKFPLQFPLPVQLNVPIDDTIDLNYTGPLSADIDQELTTTVDTVLRATLPVNQQISTPVAARIPLRVYPDDEQVRLIIHKLELALRPASMLSFGLAEEEALDGPERVPNPWGPLDQGGEKRVELPPS